MLIEQLKKQRMVLLIASVVSGVILVVLIAVVIYLVHAIRTVDDSNKDLKVQNSDFQA
jgi:hypothetical protein